MTIPEIRERLIAAGSTPDEVERTMAALTQSDNQRREMQRAKARARWASERERRARARLSEIAV